MKKLPVIFISGTGRSGTNITKGIFARHSQVAALPFEYRISIDPGGIVDFINSYSAGWSPYYADQKLRNLEDFLLSKGLRNDENYRVSRFLKQIDKEGKKITGVPYAGWELDQWFPGYRSAVIDLMNELTDFKYNASWPGAPKFSTQNEMYFGKPKNKKELISIFSKFLLNCYQSFVSAEQKGAFVEDNTWTILFAEDVLKLVPQGKILHIKRDPRDVIASLMKQRWTPSDLDQVILWYQSVISQWESQKKVIPHESFLEIDLDNIINNTEETIKKMCNFTGLPFENGMIDIDLSKGNKGRYKKQFSAEEVNKIERILDC